MTADPVAATDDTLRDALERFLGAPAAERAASLRALLAALKLGLAHGDGEGVAAALRRAVVPGLDFTSAQGLLSVYRRLRARAPAAAKVKVAVLGGFTTHQLTELLDLHLFAAGLPAELHEADYGVLRQEILDPASPLYEQRPDFVLLLPTWRDLSHVPELAADRARVAELVAREVAEWRALWDTLHARLPCQIVQDNFAPPPWRTLANHEMSHPASLARFAALVNRELHEQAPGWVTIHDVDELAASIGRRAFHQERFWHHAKLPCAPECLVDYAHGLASVIAAHRGLAKKCLVLDLDNTLWGGVIGDDGLAGIRVGQGDGESEAFRAVQAYAKALQQRGVILAVCSANDEATARDAFTSHPGMVLRLDDISCFVANWNSKADNIATIAERLEIGRDGIVFLDDDPLQRTLVRRMLPEVLVPELPPDPAEWITALERYRCFQTVALGAEDLARTASYRANAQRHEALAAAGNVDDFLAALDMVARVAPVDATTLDRTVQLVQKTNQWNLTTRRHAAARVAAIAASPDWVTRTVSLRDRYGDNGLISVLLAERTGDALAIDTWLMSCRVLRRGVERVLLNDLLATACALGVRKIRGEYVPTAKNGLVAQHYPTLGFIETARHEDGRVEWELDVASAQPHATFIRVE
jgi:FkbH-like protein